MFDCISTAFELQIVYALVSTYRSYAFICLYFLCFHRLTDDNNASNKLFFYCDIHGHSRKHNYFMYGCGGGSKSEPGDLSTQVFPLLLSYTSPKMFSFESCRFHVRKDKEGTARVVAFNFGVKYSYTLEASLGGTNLEGKVSHTHWNTWIVALSSRCVQQDILIYYFLLLPISTQPFSFVRRKRNHGIFSSQVGHHFNTTHYKMMGRHFCDALLEFSDDDPSKERMRTRIQTRLAEMGSCAEWPAHVPIHDLESEDQTEDSGSESRASSAKPRKSSTSPGKDTSTDSECVPAKRKSSQKWKRVQNSQIAFSALKHTKTGKPVKDKRNGRSDPRGNSHSKRNNASASAIAPSMRRRITESYKMAKIGVNNRPESSMSKRSELDVTPSEAERQLFHSFSTPSATSSLLQPQLKNSISSFELSNCDRTDEVRSEGGSPEIAKITALMDSLNFSPAKKGFHQCPPVRRHSSSFVLLDAIRKPCNSGINSPQKLGSPIEYSPEDEREIQQLDGSSDVIIIRAQQPRGYSDSAARRHHVRAAISTTRLCTGFRSRSRTPHHLGVPGNFFGGLRAHEERSKSACAVSPPPKPEDLLERRGIIPTFLRSPAKKPQLPPNTNHHSKSSSKKPTNSRSKRPVLEIEDVDAGHDRQQFFPTLGDALGMFKTRDDDSSVSDSAVGGLSACEGVPEAPPPPVKVATGKKKLLPVKNFGKSSSSSKNKAEGSKNENSGTPSNSRGTKRRKKRVVKHEITQMELTAMREN
ncbi:unnamed protein product [Notodromas monacha]|uniref:Cytosolic carboxypeptidase-like protein 5 n=1 Tax=Notodromas monacha TaxID=399045 RepID=A0A7R9G9T8_9CRUS|nr:unnamed protein product [Notodromas monacha]CAG0914647.1 unnamed protein product [Notodromas monacha]